MQKAWQIGTNSLRIAVKNRMVLIFSLLMPLGFTWIMGMFMGGSPGSGPARLAALYVDADQSDLSQRLLQILADDRRFAWQAATDQDAAAAAVRAGRVAGVVLVPQGFAAAVRGQGPRVDLTALGLTGDARLAALRSALEAAAVRLQADAGAADAVVQGLRTADLHQAGSGPAGPEPGGPQAAASPGSDAWASAFQQADAYWQQPLPVAMQAEVAAGGSASDLTGYTQASMGFLLTFLMFTVAFSAGSILEERRDGTWVRLLSTPTSRAAILGGKLIGTLLLGLLQIITMVAFGSLVLRVPWGRSPLGVALVLAAFLWAAIGIGLLLAGLVRTPAQLGAVVPIVMISTAMLGGCYWPLEIVPRFMQVIGYATPHAWAMQALTDLIARHRPLQAALLPTLVLAVYGAVAFALGLSRVRYE